MFTNFADDGKEWVGKHFSRSRDKQSSEIDSDEEFPTEEETLNDADEFTNRFSSVLFHICPLYVIILLLCQSSKGEDELETKDKENEAQKSFTEIEGSTKLWIGKDYTNCIVKDFVHLDKPLQGCYLNCY